MGTWSKGDMMSDSVRQHLPVIAVVTVVGLATGAFAMMRVADAAAGLDLGTFSLLMLVAPCAVMLVGSFIIAATATRIERQLYVVVLATCLAAGLVSLVAAAAMTSDPAIAAALQANTADGTQVIPDTGSPILVLRDIAAYVVAPTVGCIAGAWVGSRLHPMSASPRKRK